MVKMYTEEQVMLLIKGFLDQRRLENELREARQRIQILEDMMTPDMWLTSMAKNATL